jgi:hypothetical protein
MVSACMLWKNTICENTVCSFEGGGGRSPILICSEKKFFGSGRAQSENYELKAPATSRFLIIWTWQLCLCYILSAVPTQKLRASYGLGMYTILVKPNPRAAAEKFATAGIRTAAYSRALRFRHSAWPLNNRSRPVAEPIITEIFL